MTDEQITNWSIAAARNEAGEWVGPDEWKRRFAELVAAHERIECAQLAAGHYIPGHSIAGPGFAMALVGKIRARGQ